MIKRLTLIGLALLLFSGVAFADGKSLTYFHVAADLNAATGFLKIKQVILISQVGAGSVALEDGHAITGTPDLEFVGSATETLTFTFGDDDDFILFSTGLYIDVTNATATIILLGNGKTTIQNDNATTTVLHDPVSGVRRSVVAGGTATFRDEFAVEILQDTATYGTWSIP